MTTRRTKDLTRWAFVGKVMFLLFNMLFRFVIDFLPRSKNLLISWLQSSSVVIMEPKKIKSVTVSIVSQSICHDLMGPANKGPSSHGYGFSSGHVWTCESWTMKKAEHRRIDAFELWCWRRLSRVFFSITVWKHQFFSTQVSLWSNSHIHTWLLEEPKIWLDGPLSAKLCFYFLICCLGLS